MKLIFAVIFCRYDAGSIADNRNGQILFFSFRQKH